MIKIKKIFSTYFYKEDGAAAIEFAFSAPLLLILILGLVDMGSYIQSRIKLEQIARASADFVLQGGDENQIEEVVIGYYDSNHSNEYDLETQRICTCSDGVEQSCGAVSCGQGDHSRQFIDISLSKNYSTHFSYPGIPSTVSLSGQARLRLD